MEIKNPSLQLNSKVDNLGMFVFPAGWSGADWPHISFGNPSPSWFATNGYIISACPFTYNGVTYSTLVVFWIQLTAIDNLWYLTTVNDYSHNDIMQMDCGLFTRIWDSAHITVYLPHSQKAAFEAVAVYYGWNAWDAYATNIFAYMKIRLDLVDAEITATQADIAAAQAANGAILPVAITLAADAGDVTLATCSVAPVLVRGLNIKSESVDPTTTDFASIGIYACSGSNGYAKSVTMLSPADGIRANLLNSGNQMGRDFGPAGVYLDAGDTIVATLTGSGGGSTPVNFMATFVYVPTAVGGLLS